VDVKIGIQQAPREIVVETDETPETISAKVSEALSGDGVLTLADSKGRVVIVPAAKIAYVELGATAVGTVGFRS
jgi:hypothetical protein